MNDEVRIWKEKDKKGKDIFCVTVLGKYAEFPTQLEAANFADAIRSVEKKKNGNK